MTPVQRYHAQYRLDAAKGKPRARIPAWKVVAHVNRLAEAGAHPAGIAEAAGVSRHTIRRIQEATLTTVNAPTAAAILAVTPKAALTREHNGFIAATGTRRRWQALQAIGWSSKAVNERAGENVAPTYRGGWVQARVARRVRQVYDELSMIPGPSEITRARAAASGYAPPLAWDEGQIDDPTAEPHPWLEQADEA